MSKILEFLKNHKWGTALLITLFLILGYCTILAYRWIKGDNVIQSTPSVIFIPTGSSYEDVIKLLTDQSILANKTSFERVAKWMDYKKNEVRPGKYTIQPDWSNRQILKLLRSGEQTPVNLVINNVRTINELAGKISSQIEPDSSTIANYFSNDSILQAQGYNVANALSIFIPETYQVYWTISPQELLNRMIIEHDRFWSRENRTEKRQGLDLSEAEVYTLASIVERETQAKSERARVAGLYLNRLRLGIPLQADPTVVFATGLYDLRRVLLSHLEIDSPYNTYRYKGLPPGPIYMPTIQSIDAVLNAEKHSFLYMCAKPDNSGQHVFAATLAEHGRNADRYRIWLDQRGIR